jgi:hypothetical protein
VKTWERCTFVYLADGRVFVRDDGDIREATDSERAAGMCLLFEQTVGLDPIPAPADS